MRPDGKYTGRMLNFALEGMKFEEVDGGLLVKDVTILAEGTWTDSYAQTPCLFGADVLRECAANWKANGYWLRHRGNAPRSMDERVGEIRNPHYADAAVKGDIFLHLASTRSRDHAEMVKRGYANALSAEIDTLDEWDAARQTYVAKYIEFSGCASVDRGACERCKIRENESQDNEGTEMDKAELEQALAGFKAEFMGEVGKELDKRFAAIAPAAKPEELKELSEKLSATAKELEAAKKAAQGYEERLKKIENAPDPKTFASGERELEAPAAARAYPVIRKGSIEIE